MSNWYVLRVKTGNEKKVIEECKNRIDHDLLLDTFIPYRCIMKKYRGEWQKLVQPMFPGYVFLITDDIASLNQAVKVLPYFNTFVGKHEKDIFPILDEEEAFIKEFTNEKLEIEMSRGYIEGDRVKVMEGPLKGYEGLIKKIDRHKRIATLQLEFFQDKIDVKVGLEIVYKNN